MLVVHDFARSQLLVAYGVLASFVADFSNRLIIENMFAARFGSGKCGESVVALV